MNKRGQFISIEGLDGSGKTTNIGNIERILTQKGVEFISTREPGGTAVGEDIRKIVLHSKANLDIHAELLLIFAARAQHIASVIEPALSQGITVLCDRFTDATYAYQGGGRDIKMSLIEQLEKHTITNIQPDITFLLDLPIDVSVERAQARSAPDRFEQEQIAFKQRVRNIYLERAQQFPERIQVINANQSKDAVEQQIQLCLDTFLRTPL